MYCVCMGSEYMVFLVFKAVSCIILSVCMCCQVSNERYSCAGRHDVTLIAIMINYENYDRELTVLLRCMYTYIDGSSQCNLENSHGTRLSSMCTYTSLVL